MARRHPILRGLGLLVAIVVVLSVLLAVVAGRDVTGGLSFANTVAVIDLRGILTESAEVVDALEGHRKNDRMVAVVVRIDSPGGAVAPSQEIYDAIWRVREQKPVIASLGNVAASGGYYVASAANWIVADPGTITGSIGVIMEVRNFETLADKIGVREEIVKSGRYKDTGHPLRPMTPEERVLLQEMVDDVQGQFVKAVARGRGMEEARVRQLADGRIYSGAQAYNAGLVDELGSLHAAVRVAWERAGQPGEPRVSHVKPRHRPWWLELLNQVADPAFVQPGFPDGGLFFLYRGPLPG